MTKSLKKLIKKKSTIRVKKKHPVFDVPLDAEEKELLRSFEKGEWKMVDNFKEIKTAAEEAARNHIRREKAIISLISKRDFTALKQKAARKGLTYQTFIASILHQYAIGDLEEKAA